MKFKRSTLCALSCLFMFTGSAFADINYTLTAGTDVISFSLPQVPAGVQANCNYFGDTSGFCVVPVSLTVDGSSVIGNVGFYQPGVGGGLDVCTGTLPCALGTVLVNNDGPGFAQLFSGTLENPTLETFSNAQLIAAGAGNPLYNEAFTLNAVATPEPGYYGLLFGLGVVMVAVRLRRAKQQA